MSLSKIIQKIPTRLFFKWAVELATLVTHFTFDNGSFLYDSDPNSLSATTQSTSLTLLGRYSPAITSMVRTLLIFKSKV